MKRWKCGGEENFANIKGGTEAWRFGCRRVIVSAAGRPAADVHSRDERYIHFSVASITSLLAIHHFDIDDK